VTPAELLGHALADARRAGDRFDAAWTTALSGATADLPADERARWRAALHETRSAWQAAWERRPPTRAQRELLTVASDPERVEPCAVELYADERLCECCGASIAPGRDPRTMYCTARCRRAAYELRRAA
jgi:hypothetical protein